MRTAGGRAKAFETPESLPFLNSLVEYLSGELCLPLILDYKMLTQKDSDGIEPPPTVQHEQKYVLVELD